MIGKYKIKKNKYPQKPRKAEGFRVIAVLQAQ